MCRVARDFGAPELHPGSEGIAFNANYLVADDVMVFARGGWSEGWVIDRNFTVGLGWRPRRAPSDLAGFGFGWAEPANEFLPLQKTAELFYRFQLTQNLALTPDIQFITNPSLDPLTDTLWVFSVRTRLTF